MAKGLYEQESPSLNTIAQGTTIKGDIEANGDFRLDGKLEGNIILRGKLIVGENGLITGNVTCTNANIIGKVLGNITVAELLALHRTANVHGDIIINQLSIEPGAKFSGTCSMLDEVKQAQSTVNNSANVVKKVEPAPVASTGNQRRV